MGRGGEKRQRAELARFFFTPSAPANTGALFFPQNKLEAALPSTVEQDSLGGTYISSIV